MMILTEVNAFFDLVLKANNFAVQLKDGWYKNSAEVDTFLDQVPILCEKHDQWSAQLRRHGLSEDKYMLRAVEAAIQVLDEQQKYVARLQKKPLLRFRKKAFPAQLLNCLNRVSAIVDAGPKLLESRVVTHDLLERNGAQTPAPLPFVPDPNYVPIADSILKIQKALEREEGRPVITLYGGPGLGKSSAVKYIALQYAEEKTNSSSSTFPDGVFYLFCGRGAQDRVKDLHLELFKSLGFAVAFGAPPNDSTAGGVQEGEYFHLPSHQMNLRSRLLEQRLLIILDDLWEREVLQELLVLTKGVKYLITSQNREIWGAAEKVQMENPTISEARHIMANFTDGLPTKGKFPDIIQRVTDAVIHRLNYHPLSLADVGSSVNRKRATDESQWKVILDNIHVLLDENDFQGCPVMFDRPYNLTVGASMMLMVESLRPEIQRFLFLIALLGGEKSLPEPLVRFFHKFLQTVPSDAFLWKYYNEEKYLEDRSLIELHSRGDESQLDAHSLRMHFIREQKPLELRSIASQILASSDQGIELTQSGDGDGTLVTILSAVYFQKPFKDVVANALEKHLGIINDGVIDRNISSETDILHFFPEHRCRLVGLLNVDDGEPVWKRQAHGYARKIIIKLACQGILDDYSMVCLLKLPQTTSVACSALSSFGLRYGEAFSSTNGETMRTLLTLLDDDAASTTRRAAVCLPLLKVLDHESKDTILNVAATWMEILAMDSNLSLQIAIMNALTDCTPYVTGRPFAIMGKFTGILEVMMELFFASKDCEVRNSAGETIMRFCMLKGPALTIAAIPGALAKLVNVFVSKETPLERFSIAGALLGLISCVPQNRVRLRIIEGCLEGLEDILANVEAHWRATCEETHRNELEKRATIAAGILAQLAVEDELRGTIASLPGVQEGLLFLQRIHMAGLLTQQDVWHWYNLIHSTRALTILYPDQADLPSLERVQEVSSGEGGPTSGTCSATKMYANIYWTRVVAHMEVGAYTAALESWNLAHSYLEQIPNGRESFVVVSNPWSERSWGGRCAIDAFSSTRRFLLVMLEDHAGALLVANTDVAIYGKRTEWTSQSMYKEALIERGIIKRLSGDLQGALDDLNLADNIEVILDGGRLLRHYVLKHRSYVKHLMKDDEGAKEDTKVAQQLEREECDEEKTYRRVYRIIEHPIDYFGQNVSHMYLDPLSIGVWQLRKTVKFFQ